MKKIYLMAAMLTAGAAAVAQPTLNNALNYSIGDSVKYYTSDSSAFNPGGTGANQTWNFSSLPIVDSFVQKIASPSGSQFPNANLVELSAGGSEIYINNTANSYNVVGIVQSSSNLNMRYTNSQKMLERPVTFNNSLTDTFESQYTYSGQNLSGGGITTTEADGYGTLTLPDSTYNNVLRLRAHSVQKDSISGSPIPIYIDIVRTSYMWLVDGYKEPILRADSFYLNSPGPAITTYTVAYRPKRQTVGINDISISNNAYSCYLDKNVLKLNGELNSGKEYTIRVYNQSGSVVDEKKFTGKGNSYQTSIAELPYGVYIISLQEEHGSPVYLTTGRQ